MGKIYYLPGKIAALITIEALDKVLLDCVYINGVSLSRSDLTDGRPIRKYCNVISLQVNVTLMASANATLSHVVYSLLLSAIFIYSHFLYTFHTRRCTFILGKNKYEIMIIFL